MYPPPLTPMRALALGTSRIVWEGPVLHGHRMYIKRISLPPPLQYSSRVISASQAGGHVRPWSGPALVHHRVHSPPHPPWYIPPTQATVS